MHLDVHITQGVQGMTQVRYDGRGIGDGRAGRNGRGGAGQSGRSAGYTSIPKSIKNGICKEFDGHALDYDGHDAAGKVRIPMEKVQQFVGITYGYPVRGVSILCFLLTIALISFSQVFATMSVCGTLDMALNLSSPYSLATEMGNLAMKTTTTSTCLAKESGEALATKTITTSSCLAKESGEALATETVFINLEVMTQGSIIHCDLATNMQDVTSVMRGMGLPALYNYTCQVVVGHQLGQLPGEVCDETVGDFGLATNMQDVTYEMRGMDKPALYKCQAANDHQVEEFPGVMVPEFEHLCDDDSIGALSHAQVGRIVLGGSGEYACASQSTSLEDPVIVLGVDDRRSESVGCVFVNDKTGNQRYVVVLFATHDQNDKTQVTEVCDNLRDNNSFGVQSHAQVGRIVMGASDVYVFASRSTSLEEYVCLDSCLSEHVFCDSRLVLGIRKGEWQLNLDSNSGSLPISEIANVKGLYEDVWFSMKAITNILSLKKVRNEFPVSYDGDNFIIHRALQGYFNMVSKLLSWSTGYVVSRQDTASWKKPELLVKSLGGYWYWPSFQDEMLVVIWFLEASILKDSALHVLDINDPRSQESYAFVETVADNMQMFTKREIADGNLARDLQAVLGYPSNGDLKWIIQANYLKDNPVRTRDVDVALKIYGPSVALLKGKTVCKTAPVARQDVVEVPKEIRMLHKRVTLSIDIFFVNGIPYFATLSMKICFLSVTHLPNRKIPTIFKALKAMHNYYLQRGFQIVFIKGDGEFKPLKDLVESELYGGPTMNLTSAKEHEPYIERKTRVIKERLRAIIYSMPVNAVPSLVMIHMVLFVAKALNIFPVKGGIPGWSPKQIMTGEVVNYKYYCVPFGSYCQISSEDTPRNSMLARTEGAIALGPSGNAQGGIKFYTLNTGKVVVRQHFKKLPMTDEVIARIGLLAVGQPSHPVVTDRRGRPIGEAVREHFDYDNDNSEADDDLPGVHLPTTDDTAETTGVGTIDQEPTPDDTIDDDVDVGNDFGIDEPQDTEELVQNDNVAVEPVAVEPVVADLGAVEFPVGGTGDGNVPSAPAGVRRSTRERKPVVNYKPGMTGKKYSFAAMELITTELGLSYCNDSYYEHDAEVACTFMQQLSLKAALRQWGTDAEEAGIKEVSQMHWRDTFVPKRWSNLTHEEKRKVLESHMFVAKKRDGTTKARWVAGGNAQRDYLTKEDASSPTVSTQAVLLTSIIDAHERRHVVVIDIPNAFIQTRVQNKKDRVIIRIRGVVVEWLVKIAPDVYGPFVYVDKKGNKVLLVECWNAIYGAMVAGLLYYRKFSESLAEQGYVANAYDPCVWNKVIQGKQSTISFHVDDCKISHVSEKVNEDTISWLRRDYESIFTDGSGEMKVARGKVHKYLGMKLDFTNVGVVIVTMIDYINDVIKAWDDAVTKFNDGFEPVEKRQRIATAAPEDLFKINEDAVKLDKDKSKVFHSIVAMILYIVKRARPDAALANAFLTTRVRGPDEDDWRKLRHLINYFRSTRELPLVLGAAQTGVLQWYVDASFAVYQDMRGQTGGALTLGRGCPTVQTTKTKCATRSSTIQELVAVDEMMSDILWTRLFMKEQGIKVTDNILYQDNKSAILLEKNGQASSSKRTKHIEIRYYYVADRIAKGDLTVVWCPTDKMIADYLTKPLQGKMFIKFRNLLMGAVPMWHDVD